jgi:hypothetical protein
MPPNYDSKGIPTSDWRKTCIAGCRCPFCLKPATKLLNKCDSHFPSGRHCMLPKEQQCDSNPGCGCKTSRGKPGCSKCTKDHRRGRVVPSRDPWHRCLVLRERKREEDAQGYLSISRRMESFANYSRMFAPRSQYPSRV